MAVATAGRRRKRRHRAAAAVAAAGRRRRRRRRHRAGQHIFVRGGGTGQDGVSEEVVFVRVGRGP